MSIEPVVLRTSDDVLLEAELAVPDPGPAWAGAVLLHPHPQQGGTMRSIVPGTLFAELPAAGVAALRFNFRGVGASTGAYGGGTAERLDVVAAIDVLASRLPEPPAVAAGVAGVAAVAPLVLAGWSFGADVSLTVDDRRLSGWFCAAAPLRLVEPSTMAAAHDPRPKLLAVPERDQFCPPAVAAAAVEGWTACRLEVVPGADHFFVGRTDRLTPLCLSLLRSL